MLIFKILLVKFIYWHTTKVKLKYINPIIRKLESVLFAELFLLVHGSWHGGWCWYKVISLLEKDYSTTAKEDVQSPAVWKDNHDGYQPLTVLLGARETGKESDISFG